MALSPPSPVLAYPYRSLASVFCAWKGLLLLIAAAATVVGPAYDTSASHLAATATTTGASAASSHSGLARFLDRLTSWDAVYYVQAARRGRVYEQEWAFGSGLPLTVSVLNKQSLGAPSEISIPAVAIVVAHAAHLLSALALFRLGRLVWHGARARQVAFVAAVLHILSPAGLFLSAPYAESSCALLSFAGYLALAAAFRQEACLSLGGDALRLLAGALFGLATVFRSNALINGLPFAYEAVVGLARLVSRPRWPAFRRLATISLGGLLVAAGAIVPQAVAYMQFCRPPLLASSAQSGLPGQGVRPWCRQTLPSIYSFVQGHYWNVGLFRYWTLSNLPLFFLAAPMLFVLISSGLDLLAHTDQTQPLSSTAPEKSSTEPEKPSTEPEQAAAVDPRLVPLVRCMAASQLLLAVMAIVGYHIQIITRISSGYAAWYWWLAQNLAGGNRRSLAGAVVIFMIMYAAIQGVLFASFLPPA